MSLLFYPPKINNIFNNSNILKGNLHKIKRIEHGREKKEMRSRSARGSFYIRHYALLLAGDAKKDVYKE